MEKQAKAIFDRWKSLLNRRPTSERETSKATSNFGELFYELYTKKIPLEIVYDMMDDIVTAHMPTYVVAERVWQVQKSKFPGISKKDWLEDWRSSIENMAKAALYDFYTLPGDDEVSDTKTGGMTKEEAARYKQYADSFPSVTPEEMLELERKRQTFLNDTTIIDFEKLGI